MSNINLNGRIKKLIEKKSEGDYWDYKQVWHEDNERLLHDILCFANTGHDRDCYLIIGVSDAGKIVGVSEKNRRNQAGILDLLSNTNFVGDNTPKVRLNTIKIEGKEVDVLTILNSYNVPYYLKKRNKKYNNIREGYIYTRVGDKNTPIDENASIQQIEMLWKKRFKLTQPLLTQIVNRLENISEWVQCEDVFYNVYNPEFKLEEEYDDEYDLSLKIMCNETILKKIQIIVNDGGRYKTPLPEYGYICSDERNDKYKYTYIFFLKDSIDYKLQQFLLNTEYKGEESVKIKFDKVIIYYESKEEKKAFESYVESNQSIIDSYLPDNDEIYLTKDVMYAKEEIEVKHMLSTGLVLNKLLQEFRGLYK